MWSSLRKKLQQGKTWLATGQSLPALLRDQIEQKIWQETVTEVQTFIRELHQDLAFAILWQNGVLLAAMTLSWYYLSSWPFYFCYGLIWSYSVWRSWQLRQYLRDYWRCGSLPALLADYLTQEIQTKLQKTGRLERFLVQHFGPDITEMSQRFARQIYPDLRLALVQASLSLGFSIVVFRLWILPRLLQGLN